MTKVKVKTQTRNQPPMNYSAASLLQNCQGSAGVRKCLIVWIKIDANTQDYVQLAATRASGGVWMNHGSFSCHTCLMMCLRWKYNLLKQHSLECSHYQPMGDSPYLPLVPLLQHLPKRRKILFRNKSVALTVVRTPGSFKSSEAVVYIKPLKLYNRYS